MVASVARALLSLLIETKIAAARMEGIFLSTSGQLCYRAAWPSSWAANFTAIRRRQDAGARRDANAARPGQMISLRNPSAPGPVCNLVYDPSSRARLVSRPSYDYSRLSAGPRIIERHTPRALRPPPAAAATLVGCKPPPPPPPPGRDKPDRPDRCAAGNNAPKSHAGAQNEISVREGGPPPIREPANGRSSRTGNRLAENKARRTARQPASPSAGTDCPPNDRTLAASLRRRRRQIRGPARSANKPDSARGAPAKYWLSNLASVS